MQIVFCLAGSLARAHYAGGNGTADDPYTIATAQDLLALGESPEDYDQHFLLTADIDLDPNLPGGKIFDRAVIAPDADPNDPRKFQGTPFTGSLEGNGHTISNLTIAGAGYLGLFGRSDAGARILNLNLQAVNIEGTDWYVGGLVGYSDGAIAMCHSTGAVQGDRRVGGLVGYHGGSGRITGSSSLCTTVGRRRVGGIVGCNVGTVAGSCNGGPVRGEKNVGGLVGWNYGSIHASYSNGTVDAESQVGGIAGFNGDGSVLFSYSSSPVRGASDAGGLVGYNYGYSRSSFWDIQTSGQTTSADDEGTGLTTAEMQDMATFIAAGWDFVGPQDGPHDTWAEPPGKGYPILWWQLSPASELPAFSGGTGEPHDPFRISTPEQLNSLGCNPRLMRCCFTLAADLDLTGVDFHPIGGPYFPYAGVFDGGDRSISHLTIRGDGYLGLFGCLSSGAEVRNLEIEDVDVVGSRGWIGGLAGYCDRARIHASHCDGRVVGSWSVGGLVGDNSGNITASNSSCTVSGEYGAGGLVGANIGSIDVSYSDGVVDGVIEVGGLAGGNSGSITASCSRRSVRGESSIGGLVGWNRGGIRSSYSSSPVEGSQSVGGLAGENHGSIDSSYSHGRVSGWDSTGGLAGNNEEGSITASFWDIQTSGQTTSDGDGGTGRTTAEMQTLATFLAAGWDFVGETANGAADIWWILEGRDYPKLWWELDE